MLAAALLNYADDEGYFKANPKLVQSECCPLREPSVSIHDSLINLVGAGYLRMGTGPDGKAYGHIINFNEHQRVNRPIPSKIKCIEISWETSPTTHTQLTEASPPEGKGREGEIEGKGYSAQARVTSIREKPKATNEEFEKFKNAYPKRKGSNPWEPARQKFERAVRDGARPEDIIAGCERYAQQERQLKHVETEFVMQAVRWLNSKCWQDYGEGSNSDKIVEAVEFVTIDDYRWPTLAERHERERGKPPPKTSGVGGMGWHFSKAWVDADLSIPPALRRTG